jgi:hypothetical protein
MVSRSLLPAKQLLRRKLDPERPFSQVLGLHTDKEKERSISSLFHFLSLRVGRQKIKSNLEGYGSLVHAGIELLLSSYTVSGTHKNE